MQVHHAWRPSRGCQLLTLNNQICSSRLQVTPSLRKDDCKVQVCHAHPVLHGRLLSNAISSAALYSVRVCACVQGPRAVLGPGTGLGEAQLIWDDRFEGYKVYASEGAHSTFAPRGDIQRQLHAFVEQKFGYCEGNPMQCVAWQWGVESPFSSAHPLLTGHNASTCWDSLHHAAPGHSQPVPEVASPVVYRSGWHVTWVSV